MILTVDIGNTNIKIGAWDNESLAFVVRLQTNPRSTQDEYAIQLSDLMRLNECNPAQFDGAIISSVVPPLSDVFKKAVRQVLLTKRVYLVSPGLKTGLNIKIENPATLGADMVSAAVAAIHKYPLPCIAISLGTATAIFAIDSEGAFLGCSVGPGLGISLEALSARTAQLPLISFEEPEKLIGTNTIESMKSGAIYGTACMLDGMVARMKRQLGEEATVVASGGYARSIIGQCEQEMIYDDTLVLEGLKLIYYKNAK